MNYITFCDIIKGRGEIMNIKDLKIFITVAEEKSISETAKKLNYVQSNISSRIQKLEKTLSTKLFYRNKNGMTLTGNGTTLIDYANKIVSISEEMKEVINESDNPRGKLDIASVETVIKLPLILSKYNKNFKDVDLTLSTGVTTELRNKVMNYELDGAFVTKNINTSHKNLKEIEVFNETLVLISDVESKTISDTINLPILGFSDGCGYRLKLNEWLNHERIVPSKVMELGTLETTLGSVISGLGIAYVPYSAVEHYEASGLIRCHYLPKEFSEIKTIFIYRDEKHTSLALRKFVETIDQSKDEAISPFYAYKGVVNK